MSTTTPEEDMTSSSIPLSQTSQAKIYVLLEKCLVCQRRLETACQSLADEQYYEALALIEDTKNYRKILVHDLTTGEENAIVLENLRIIEKAMGVVVPRTENLCLNSGEFSRSV